MPDRVRHERSLRAPAPHVERVGHVEQREVVHGHDPRHPRRQRGVGVEHVHQIGVARRHQRSHATDKAVIAREGDRLRVDARRHHGSRGARDSPAKPRFGPCARERGEQLVHVCLHAAAVRPQRQRVQEDVLAPRARFGHGLSLLVRCTHGLSPLVRCTHGPAGLPSRPLGWNWAVSTTARNSHRNVSLGEISSHVDTAAAAIAPTKFAVTPSESA